MSPFLLILFPLLLFLFFQLLLLCLFGRHFHKLSLCSGREVAFFSALTTNVINNGHLERVEVILLKLIFVERFTFLLRLSSTLFLGLHRQIIKRLY